MDSDPYQSVIYGPPSQGDQSAALIAALRNQRALGQIGMLTTDPGMSALGKSLVGGADTQAEEIGQQRQHQLQLAQQQAQMAQTGAYQQGELAHQKAEESQAKATLAETIRENNQKHQEKMWEYGMTEDGKPDPGFQARRKAILEYRAAPPSPNTRNPREINLLNSVYEEPTAEGETPYNPEYYHAQQAYLDDMAKGKNYQLTKSVNAAIPHMGELDGAIDALGTTRFSIYNAAINAMKKAAGISNAPTNFDAMKHLVSTEVTKFIVGGGTGAGALADRQELANDLNAATNPAALHDVLKKWRGLMGDQVRAMAQGYESNVRMKGRPEFSSYLLPEVRKTFGYDQKPNAAPQGSGVDALVEKYAGPGS